MPFNGDPINLNGLHLMVGGVSETTCSITDTDILTKRTHYSQGTDRSFSHWYITPDHTYTVNSDGNATDTAYGYDGENTGFNDIDPDPPNIGNIWSGWAIDDIFCILASGPSDSWTWVLRLHTTGPGAVSMTNSGWEALKVGDLYLYRGDADYSEISGEMVYQWPTYPGGSGFVESTDTTVKIG